jgi:virginiamycin B lyase
VADDVTQATFAQVWQQRQTLRSPEAIKGWTYEIAYNLALKQVSRARVTLPIETQWQLAAVEPRPDQAAETSEAARLVWDAAASLEPRQRAILDLSVRRGLNSGEIAAILDVDTARASLNVNRAREALGNAVRYLLVARRRSHCQRLAELVPAGIRQLTPEQRATVDHHMRRCPDCQGMALRLTAPEELFGTLALLPLPPRLTAPPQIALGAPHLAGTASEVSSSPLPPVSGRARRPTAAGSPRGRGVRLPRRVAPLHTAMAGGIAVAVVAGLVFGIARLASTSPAPPTGPTLGNTSASLPPTGVLISGQITEYPTFSSDLGDITAGPDGALWFTASDPGEIGRLLTSGTVDQYPLPSQDSEPDGIAAGSDGAVWFTELTDEGLEIGRITMSGSISDYRTPDESSSDTYPGSIAAGADGALWFTAPDANAIGRITTAGAVEEYSIPTPDSDPWGITRGPDGAMWFTEQSGKIGRITPSGSISQYPSSLDDATYIAAGSDGALWFTSQVDGAIGRITTSGSVRTYQLSLTTQPWEIAAGPDGALWFTEVGGGKLGRISTAGQITYLPLNGGSVTAGPDGALWVTVGNRNDVARVT